MPNGAQSDISDSYEVCRVLGIDYQVVNIENSYDAIISQIESVPEALYPGNEASYHAATEVNIDTYNITSAAAIDIAPRVRMTTLYAIAQSLGYRVAGTGNRSERAVGYCTKWGDMASDIDPIAGLTATEVVILGDLLNLPKELVHKTPADGLTGVSDEEKFGFSYEDLDKFIMVGTSGKANVDELISDRISKSRHKLGVYAPAYVVTEVYRDLHYWRATECKNVLGKFEHPSSRLVSSLVSRVDE